MAKYRLGDIAPVCQGMVADSNQCWLLNLDVVESNTGKILEYVYVDHSQIGASTVSFDKMNVLYSKLRPYLNKVVLPDRAGYATSEMLPLRPNEQVITREYLTYFLRSPHFVKYINGKTSGAKMPRANIADLKAVEIECPSIMEQNRITTQFDLITRVIEKRQKELSTFDNLIKARFVEMFGDPISNPKHWKMVELGTLTKVGSSKRIFEKEYVPEGVPFYRTKEIVELSKGNQISTELFITRERFDEIKRQYGAPKAGDLLISAVGTIGVIWIVDGKNDFYFKDGNLIRVDGSDKFDSLYMKSVLENLISEHKKQMSSGTAYAALTISGLSKMKVYDVPMDIQKKFATFVSQVDKSKAQVQKSLNETQLLFDSLMQKYFG